MSICDFKTHLGKDPNGMKKERIYLVIIQLMDTFGSEEISVNCSTTTSVFADMLNNSVGDMNVN